LKQPLSGNFDGGFSFDAAKLHGGLKKRWVRMAGSQLWIEYMGDYNTVTARLVVEKLRKNKVCETCSADTLTVHLGGDLWGNCGLFCKHHYVELHEMLAEELFHFMGEVQKASRALKTVSGAVKINYEIHGNTMPHLHVHLFPRYLDDAFPSAPIDYRITEPSPYASEQEFMNFIAAMRRELEGCIKE
jgi:diadenosine tetraphosphate (Ap4A) HIT family hydrolase